MANAADESVVYPAGAHPFTVALFAGTEGEHRTGEVRMVIPTAEGTAEVSLVGALTGRPGVTEITPQHLAACTSDPAYLDSVRNWLGVL